MFVCVWYVCVCVCVCVRRRCQVAIMVPTTPAVGTTAYSTSCCYNVSHRHLQPILALCLCSKKGEVLAGGVVSGDVRGHPPLLEEGREMPAVTELQVAIIERFHEKGSLKDCMHRVRGGLGDCVRWVWHHCYTKSCLH